MSEFEGGGGWPGILTSLTSGTDLTGSLAQEALGEILRGDATDAQIGGFLTALKTKGESVEEVTGLVAAMLDACVDLPLPEPAGTIDIVGTGGSSALPGGAFNVSTMASIVASAAGAVVCKHGNRRASSTSGSTDMLEALGVEVELGSPEVSTCVSELGLGFAFARKFHPAMRFVGPVRAELGIPTVFNILGPLAHPGRIGRQLVGVANPALVDLVASTLAERGITAWVAHGSDGLDEITTTGPTLIVSIADGDQERFELSPGDFGVPAATSEQISVGDPSENAQVARSMLAGESGPLRDMVVINSAAALLVAGVVEDLGAGVELAGEALDSGAAAAKLEQLVELTQHLASNA